MNKRWAQGLESLPRSMVGHLLAVQAAAELPLAAQGRMRFTADRHSSERAAVMAGSVNKVILVGNLGRDPEVRHTQNNQKVVNLRIATSRALARPPVGREQASAPSGIAW